MKYEKHNGLIRSILVHKRFIVSIAQCIHSMEKSYIMVTIISASRSGN